MSHRVAALIVASIALVLAGCGSGDESSANPPDPNSLTEEVTTVEGTDSPYAETDTGEDGGEDESGSGDPEAGAEVYASSGCGGCHTLDAAGSAGTVGPSLDEKDPSYDKAVERVTNGGNGMPSFKDELTEKQIRDVAAYVAEAAGGQ